MKQLFAMVLSTAAICAFASATPAAAQDTQDQTPYTHQSDRTHAIPPVRPTQPMMAATSLTGPGPRAGIPRKRSSAPQSRNRPVAQPKRRPHKGRREFNNNRPSSVRPQALLPDPRELAPSRWRVNCVPRRPDPRIAFSKARVRSWLLRRAIGVGQDPDFAMMLKPLQPSSRVAKVPSLLEGLAKLLLILICSRTTPI